MQNSFADIEVGYRFGGMVRLKQGFQTLNSPDPANKVLHAYLKTAGMCVGAGLELNTVGL